MKKKYLDILTILENNQKIQIRKNSSYFIVKNGREDMNNFSKKASTKHLYDQESLKDHLKQICSLHSIDYDDIENQLNKALNPSTQVYVPSSNEYTVDYGGISKYFDFILEERPAGKEKSKFYGLEIKSYNQI